MKIFLLGYMGSGKSTLGPALANKLKVPFYDLDTLIEHRTGSTIPEIFKEINGADLFRQIESQYLEELIANTEKFVCACGGGTPCFEGNLAKMNRAGTTVYLNISPTELANRIKRSHIVRPLVEQIAGENLTSFIEKQLGERDFFYTQSKITIDGMKIDLTELCEGIFWQQKQNEG